MRISRGGAALLMSCASLGFAAEPRLDNYTRYDAGEYMIVTSRGPAQTRRMVESLVKFRVTLERVLGLPARRSPSPTTILIAGTSDWFQWLEPRFYTGGNFQRAPFANYIAMNGSRPVGEDLYEIFHEYTHCFLATQFAEKYPPWFDEGLAEVMGNARFTSDAAILQVAASRLKDARTADWIPFDQLLRIELDDPRYLGHKRRNSFYAQSWLTVHFGMVEDRTFGRQILEYLNQLDARVPQEDAARRAFGTDLSLVDKKLRAYLLSGAHHPGRIKLGHVPAVNLSTGEPLSELDAMATVADFMIEFGLAAERIRPLVDSLGRRDQNATRAATLSARLASLQAQQSPAER